MMFPKREGARSESSDGASSFVRLKDGESVTGILRGPLYHFYSTGFGATTKIVGPNEGGKERYRHNIIVKDGDDYVAKIWEFGPKIYDALNALEEGGWDLQKTLLTISRTGSTKENTKYTVTPLKKEPTSATLKIIEGLKLHSLEHKEVSSAAPTRPKNFAPAGDDDGSLPF
jgi:hypothetical protein